MACVTQPSSASHKVKTPVDVHMSISNIDVLFFFLSYSTAGLLYDGSAPASQERLAEDLSLNNTIGHTVVFSRQDLQRSTPTLGLLVSGTR